MKLNISWCDVGVNVGVNVGVKIFEYIRLHTGCRTNAIAEAVDTTTRTVERHIRQLRKENDTCLKTDRKLRKYYEQSDRNRNVYEVFR